MHEFDPAFFSGFFSKNITLVVQLFTERLICFVHFPVDTIEFVTFTLDAFLIVGVVELHANRTRWIAGAETNQCCHDDNSDKNNAIHDGVVDAVWVPVEQRNRKSLVRNIIVLPTVFSKSNFRKRFINTTADYEIVGVL